MRFVDADWKNPGAARVNGGVTFAETIFLLAMPNTKIALEELQAAPEFATGLMQSMRDGVLVLDPTFVILDANPALCEMTGFSREELVGLAPPFPYWPPEEYERIQAAVSATRGGRATSFELTYMHRNGERFPVILSPFTVRNKHGDIVSYSATVKNIAARRAAEAGLQDSDRMLRLHFEQTRMAIIECGLDFRVKTWNPAAQDIFGYSAEEAIGQNGFFIVPEALRPQVADVFQALLKQSGGRRSTNENLRKDGSAILCEWYNTPHHRLAR